MSAVTGILTKRIELAVVAEIVVDVRRWLTAVEAAGIPDDAKLTEPVTLTAGMTVIPA